MPLIPQDKKAHLVVGVGLAVAGACLPMAAGAPPLPVVGFALGFAAAILKELYDTAHPPHVLDYWDAAATKAGAALGAAGVELGWQLSRVLA